MNLLRKGVMLLVSAATAMMLASCVFDKKDPRGENGTENTEILVSFVSDGSAATRSTTEGDATERKIHTLDLLVFDASGNFIERRTAQRVNNQETVFKATLLPGNNLKIHFLANCYYTLNGYNASHFENDLGNFDIDDIRALLIDNNPAALAGGVPSNGLPMWAYTTGTLVQDQVNDLGTLKLLRSVASVDVKCKQGLAVTDFQLTSLRLYFAADQGYLTVDPANIVSGETGATAYLNDNVASPEVPATMKTRALNEALLYTQPTAALPSNAIQYKMYMYDNDAPVVSSVDRRATRVVVGGKYKGGNETYYPIDFVEPNDGKTFLDIRRNYKYEFTINRVSGKGYDDPDVAAESFPVNMEFNLVPWVHKHHPHIFADGPNWITIERKSAYLHRKENSTDNIDIASNIKIDDFEFAFETDKNGTATVTQIKDATQKVTGLKIENDRFIVELFGKQAASGSELDGYFEVDDIKVTAKGAYSATPSENSDTLVITTKYSRIKVEVDIFQTDTSDDDWNNGGNIPSDLQ